MDLFVINRHGEEKPEITPDDEKAKLDRVLQQIERKKQQRIRQREREREKRRPHKLDPPQEPEHAPKRLKATENPPDILSSDTKPPTVSTDNKNQIDVKNFTILGAENVTRKPKAERVLPQWLSHPTIISSNLKNLNVKVSKLKQLDRSIRTQLKSNGIKHLFPVQAEVIPWLLKAREHADVMFPRDICVSAPTGSGKTLAFVLPVIQSLKHHTVRKIRALVILPTQDLAEQVFKAFKMFTQDTRLETGLVSGKHVFFAEQKQLVYASEAFGDVSKIDILVCTAGRLVSHLKLTKGFSLRFLEFLIIDEADRVLESVQDDWLYHLEKHIEEESSLQNRKVLNLSMLQKKRSPQKLLFSATLTQDPEKIEKLSLFQPKLFTSVTPETVENDASSGKYTTPRELTEKYIVCLKDVKPLVLYAFLKRENLTKTIVFTHSVESSHRLKIVLQSLFKSKLKIEEISSSLKGSNRDSLIRNFSKGDIDLLICTDSLARGIDLPGVNCVVSYSAPKFLKTYIHRVGRTARAGETGLAVTIVHGEQLPAFKTLLGQSKKNLEQIDVNDGLEALSKRYKKALMRLKEKVTEEEKVGMNHLISKKKSLKMEKKTRKRTKV